MSKSAQKHVAVSRRLLIGELAGQHSPAELCRMFKLKPRWLREPSNRGRSYVR